MVDRGHMALARFARRKASSSSNFLARKRTVVRDRKGVNSGLSMTVDTFVAWRRVSAGGIAASREN